MKHLFIRFSILLSILWSMIMMPFSSGDYQYLRDKIREDWMVFKHPELLDGDE